jgi:hypothetical protein
MLEKHALFPMFNVASYDFEYYDDAYHLACIESLLGPPPVDLLQRGKRTSLIYNPDGKWGRYGYFVFYALTQMSFSREAEILFQASATGSGIIDRALHGQREGNVHQFRASDAHLGSD